MIFSCSDGMDLGYILNGTTRLVRSVRPGKQAMIKVVRTSMILLQLMNVACFQEGTENTGGPITAQQPTLSPSRQSIAPIPRPIQPAADASETRDLPPRSDSERLAEWYSVRRNYEIVLADVREFYKPVRYNGCVAFLSAALRRISVNIPLGSAQQESPSLVTRPFAQYLENTLGWFRIGTAANLRAGDVVFTRDNPSYPGYPAHTYMFQSWSRQDIGIALVIDNQDFTHERNIYDNDTAFNFTPYAYALRAP
jgi:hypothetical protein